jgi:hypothetical protein
MPNLRPLAEKYLAALRKQSEKLHSDQAHAAIERLALVLEHYVVSHPDPLIHVFEQIRDELAESPLKPLQAICQTFLHEAHRLINMDYNEQHALVRMPPEIFRFFLIPEGKKFNFSSLLLFAQVSRIFYLVIREILAIYSSKLDYTSPPISLETRLIGEVVTNKHKLLPHRDWLLISDNRHDQLCARSLKGDEYEETLEVKNAQVIATTPTSNAVLITSSTGFEVWDIDSNQRFPCKNEIFLTSPAIFTDPTWTKYTLLLPDKKTLLRLDKLDFIYLTDLSMTSPHVEIDPLSANRDPVSARIRDMAITLDGKYLLVVHGHFSEGLSVWCLNTKTVHQRLFPSNKSAKGKYCSFRDFAVSRDSQSVAVVYESETNWRGKRITFCLQWKIDSNLSEKSSEILLCDIEQSVSVKKIAYTPDGTCLIGLLGGWDAEKTGFELKMWNANNGHCLHQQFFSNLKRCYTMNLCITSLGEIILIDEKNSHLQKIKFPHLPADAGIFEEEAAKISKKTAANKLLTSEALENLFIFSMSASFVSMIFTASGIALPFPFLLSLVHVTLALEGAALIIATGAVFLGMGLFIGVVSILLATILDYYFSADGVDLKTNDSVVTEQVENKMAISCDPIEAIGAYFGAFFKAKPEVVVMQAKPDPQYSVSLINGGNG